MDETIHDRPPPDTGETPPIDQGVHPRENGEDFVRLLIQHEPQVRAFLRSLLPSWNDVDDVIQEASLVAWRKFDEFEQGTAFGGWFLTIARYQALNHRRRIQKSPQVFNDELWELIASESYEHQSRSNAIDYRQAVDRCIRKLSPQRQDILLRVHSPGAVMREIAAHSGKTESAFYKLVQRLRAAIAECVAKAIAAEGV
ncbi:sigma-70 family RNA polymerase sigma factor [Neorhodopirellula pilleata]|uniref:RNA polymerase sigma factor RpoE n=1 Tax=Neorhodopirellula pilleata TaxID=2714738 RepID=A0A5C6AGW6_9BACT|nr:sigma-70 family RNA polymerase sigma factor [Neorhodopirellula pilleata]TWT98859.1 RNA polymerase sigma factor RpoE [Neorhodopirellula pilleata]